jgi:hypothetical protein
MAGVPQTLQIPPPVSIQTMLYNTYLQIIGGGNAPFVGPLDALVAQGATLLYAASSYRLLSSYAGGASRLQGNGTGSPEAEIGFLANGQLDLAAAAAIAADSGGTAAFGVTWYNQAGGTNATQATAASRMPFSTALNAKGGWGNGSASATYFDLNLGTVTFPIYLSAVVKIVTPPLSRILLGTSASATSRYMRVFSGGAMQQSWGSTITGTGNEVTNGLRLLGFLADGANSKNILDGTVLLTGNTNGTLNDMSSGRIGASSGGSTAFLNTAGNAILEFVLFSMDPTGLAGWSAFEANQLARFS